MKLCGLKCFQQKATYIDIVYRYYYKIQAQHPDSIQFFCSCGFFNTCNPLCHVFYWILNLSHIFVYEKKMIKSTQMIVFLSALGGSIFQTLHIAAITPISLQVILKMKNVLSERCNLVILNMGIYVEESGDISKVFIQLKKKLSFS